MLVDSHCHLDMLDLEKYDGNLDLAVQAAKDNDVDYLLTVSTELETFPKLLVYSKRYPHVYCSFGIHPNEAEDEVVSLETILEHGAHDEVVAIGETGLDYYRGNEQIIPTQQQNFRNHIQAAIQLQKPLIIHTRMAQADTIRIMKEEGAEKASGVMHCFTESFEMAQQAMELGFYISISGIVTFKNAKEVQSMAKQVPLERLLVETDSPFLAPMPYRGKRNEPAYVKHTAEYLAEMKGVSFEELAKVTTENFFNLFKGFKKNV